MCTILLLVHVEISQDVTVKKAHEVLSCTPIKKPFSPFMSCNVYSNSQDKKRTRQCNITNTDGPSSLQAKHRH
jgi:hypothetical protein